MEKKVLTKDDCKCRQCGRKMTLVDHLICPVCLKCCRDNHIKANGGKND